MNIHPSVTVLALSGLLCMAQAVSAHDEFKVKTITEGTEGDNALVINHGCEAREQPVRAQSVVFPGTNPELIASDGHTVTDLGEVVGQSLFAINIKLIQDKSIFKDQDEKFDGLGNAIGFFGTTGALQVNLQGRIPFQYVAPQFSASSCATAMKIEVAVADICNFNPPTIRASKVNLWLPDNGSHYAALGKARGVEGIDEAPEFQIVRDLKNNPLPATCGAGYSVTVRPTAADIDGNLGITGWQY